MAGDPTHGDGDPEALHDEEEGGESTIAMSAPSFEPTSNLPLPITNPPPALEVPPAPAAPVPPSPTGPHTAPIPFKPGAVAAKPFQRVGSSPFVATPIGGITPAGPTPNPTAKPAASPAPKTPGAAPPRIGGMTNLQRPARAQTVIGLAPPALGAQRPPIGTPAAPFTPLSSTAVSAGRNTAATKTPVDPVSEKLRARPSTEDKKPADAAPAPTPQPRLQEADDFGLDEAAGEAARAAIGGVTLRSPTGIAQQAPAVVRVPIKDNETAPTLQVDKSLGRQQESAPKSGGVPTALHDKSEEDEQPTKAVPREELLRRQDAQFVVGHGAAGEDATLAVAPAANEAQNNMAAFAKTVVGDGAFPPPYGGAQVPQPNPAPPAMPMTPPWSDPNASPYQPPPPPLWAPERGASPIMGMHANAPAGANPHLPGSNPHLRSNPHTALPSSGHVPLAGPGMGQGMGQMSHAPTPPIAAYRGDAPWQPPPARFQVSGQILLLAIVGVVCLAIFITGIVLFATTKF